MVPPSAFQASVEPFSNGHQMRVAGRAESRGERGHGDGECHELRHESEFHSTGDATARCEPRPAEDSRLFEHISWTQIAACTANDVSSVIDLDAPSRSERDRVTEKPATLAAAWYARRDMKDNRASSGILGHPAHANCD